MNQRLQATGRRTFAAMRFHNYRLYFFSQIVSFSGTWMQSVALSWLVLELTGSGTALGTVIAMQFLPTLLFGTVGGLIADRVDKRTLIMGTQTVAGTLALTLGVLTLTDTVRLWMVYALAAGFGLVTAVDNPSRQTFVMEMVGPADLANAVTLNSVVVNAARVIGPSVAGVVIAVFGTGPCFVLNGVSYAAVVVALVMIRRDELHVADRVVRGRGQLREGFRYAWSSPVLRSTLIMLVIIGMLTFEFTVTLPLLAEFTFGAGASGLAAMTALMGAGAVVGGLVVAAAGPPTPRRLTFLGALFGVFVGLVAVMPSIVLVFALMPIVGALSVSVIALSNATLQLNSLPALRGRVMSLFSVALIGSTPIGGPIVGAVAEHGSPRLALLLGGVAAVVAAAFGWTQLDDRSMPSMHRHHRAVV